MNKKKVFVFTFPAIGHLNPILPLIKQLTEAGITDIIVYSSQLFKDNIEKIGAKFREYEKCFNDNDLKQLSSEKPNDFTLIRKMQEFTDENLMKLVKDVVDDKPNLILHDIMAQNAKWVERYLSLSIDICPPVIEYSASFPLLRGIYPNQEEEILIDNTSLLEKLTSLPSVIAAFYTAKTMATKYGLKYVNPFEDLLFSESEKKTITFIYPEFQPRVETFPNRKVFVGACIDEALHINGVEKLDDENIKSILSQFPLRNQNHGGTTQKLIYISLGSFLRDQMEFYLKVIEAFKSFASYLVNKTDQKVKLEDIKVIISTGEKCFEELKSHEVPENILLVPLVPQLEILKRASLFVTHCGMNSANEALYFGVPMICVPIGADQPLIAHRLTNELKLGVTLNKTTFTPTEFQDAIYLLLTDQTFEERCAKFSETCRTTNGQKNAADFVLKELNKPGHHQGNEKY